MRTTIYTSLLISIIACGCTGPTAKQEIKKTVIKTTPIDTTISFKINNTWVTPKKSFEFNTLEKASGDTLALVTCSEYVYSPFGNITNKTEIKNGLLNNFDIKSRTDVMDIGPEEFQILKLRSSKLIFFFDNDPEGSKHSFILRGEIHDPEVRFDKNIRIGMGIDGFYQKFFDHFPETLLNRYKVVVLISCVVDIKHVYSFNDGKLASVRFIKDTYWKVDY